jgi:aminocarboxymuconate-semialdehyde decarboxylase
VHHNREQAVARAIDVHTHFVPETMPSGTGRNALWPSIEHRDQNTAAVIVGGKVFRAIDSRSWDAGRRLQDMQLDDVDVQVVSPMPELLSHWFPVDDADALSGHINRSIAKLCSAHPRSFVGIGMVPVQDPALAARRLVDIKALGLCGIEIGSHINGMALGDSRMHEFYAAAEEADLAIMIHPLHPSGIERMSGRPELAAVAAFPLETALAATSLLTHAVTERFPKLRILLSHGGGALPWILPRLKHARALGPPLQDLFARDPGEMARTFYYDTILYDRPALRFLADSVGADHIVVGSDYPFSIKQDRPAQFAEQALGISRETFAANTARFLNQAPSAIWSAVTVEQQQENQGETGG